ncbi:prolipoprotein diacylglyceryl transferase [Mycoavidus cysteinexigens]|uniref:Phosphatidylglycerol--prolipoprotein diacylglyceryl transferase n=1 Tax=Mycoavidus cysteinexigens TaxID=1553431 RepID=A0A2Z6EVP5_9BURK|nr:prolipoprotein diacylglyceryl transferase [Mycoavidus cysteinexigens]BBE09498.1 prolipoprotein diacylglyceryl transferase [Mycoavidus cysteinexigens]GAM51744.1 prolipoprotein diacylglyceryl transferase [bacterium endosymbiont of Mortierella elongata FMR23-6]GLR01320.1 prolipoprotein diacylglyceryl transferase [Mycoavidus cysteinexigens]
MLSHPQFDPIALQLGPLAVHWYGLMYLVAFLAAIGLGRWRLRLPQIMAQGWSAKALEDLMFYAVLGTILGGRLGYVVFYKASYYLAHPLDIFKVWEGGMSFHGGFLGVSFALLIYARQHQRRWLEVTDFMAPLVPAGLAAGRFGNFINGELWGRVTAPDTWWAMLFPQAARADYAWLLSHPQQAAAFGLQAIFTQYGALPRHPSQLYEVALEGFALFLLVWLFARKARPVGAVSAVFLIGYGCARFLIEFLREPDAFLGLLALGWSLGQWLSIPMVITGVGVLMYTYRGCQSTSLSKAKK